MFCFVHIQLQESLHGNCDACDREHFKYYSCVPIRYPYVWSVLISRYENVLPTSDVCHMCYSWAAKAVKRSTFCNDDTTDSLEPVAKVTREKCKVSECNEPMR